MTQQISPTERTTIRRQPKRGVFDRATIYQILDEGFVCHVGFTVEDKPYVIPTAYARMNDDLIIHGATVSRMVRALENGCDVCVTVTLIDGVVLGRSAFHHSMNYRSIVVFGTAQMIQDEAEKMAALQAFTNHVVPQRWQDVRQPNDGEMKATTVLRLPIEEASAKIRTGDPIDDEADYELDVWAGVIPLRLQPGAAIADTKLHSGILIPCNVSEYQRSQPR